MESWLVRLVKDWIGSDRDLCHVFRPPGSNQVKILAGNVYGEGEVLAEGREEREGVGVYDLLRSHAQRIGKRRLVPTEIVAMSKKPKATLRIGTELPFQELRFQDHHPQLGEEWCRKQPLSWSRDSIVENPMRRLLILEHLHAPHGLAVRVLDLHDRAVDVLSLKEILRTHARRTSPAPDP